MQDNIIEEIKEDVNPRTKTIREELVIQTGKNDIAIDLENGETCAVISDTPNFESIDDLAFSNSNVSVFSSIFGELLTPLDDESTPRSTLSNR